MAIIKINDGFTGLGTLSGKRVKAAIRAQDAAAAATAAAARANPDDAAAQERARVQAAAQAAMHASFWAAEAHKKSQEHGIRKAVSKAMDIREKIDPVARTDLGSQGVWWGLAVGIAVVAVLLMLRVRARFGRELRRIVVDDDTDATARR